MARIRKPFAKIEPEFVLGRNASGMEFLALRDDEQLIYLRWWAHCIELRKIFWKCSSEDLRILAQSLHTSFRKLDRTFERLLAKGFATKYGGNICKLNGIADMHIGLEFSDGDNTVPDMVTPEVSSHAYGRETRNKSIETTPPTPPAKHEISAKANRDGDGDEKNHFSENSRKCTVAAQPSAQGHHHTSQEAKSARRAAVCGNRGRIGAQSGCETATEPEVSVRPEITAMAETIFAAHGATLRNCGVHSAAELVREAERVAGKCGYSLADALLKFADACRYACEEETIHSPGAAARAKACNGLGKKWLGRTRRELFPSKSPRTSAITWEGVCPACGQIAVALSETAPEMRCPKPGCGKKMAVTAH